MINTTVPGTGTRLRPLSLGVLAFAQAAAVAWVTRDRAAPGTAAVDPSAHAWHSGVPTEPGQTIPTLFLVPALTTAAVYLLLPALATAACTAHGLMARSPRLADTFTAQSVFAAVTAVLSALTALPVGVLAAALSGADGTVWPAGLTDTVAVLRTAFPLALALLVCTGLPWARPEPDTPHPTAPHRAVRNRAEGRRRGACSTEETS